ncbi:DUF6221 family protein [Streptomyces sp. NPDC051994]|uniref:DUF6221 family protein n=1 Tax=unclassified Streptomyces TaxID=2593676 RepID=UPI003448363A
MTDTDRMVIWLRSAMAAAERDAEAAGGDAWTVADSRLIDVSEAGLVEVGRTVGTLVVGGGRRILTGVPAVLPHIARNGPAAVLRHIAADRKLLDLHTDDGWHDCTMCGKASEETNWLGHAFHVPMPYPCATVRLLAESWGWTEETT